MPRRPTGSVPLLALCCLSILPLSVLAAQAPSSDTPASSAASASGRRAVDYRLQPGDRISLNFEQVSEYLNRTGTIDTQGNFPLNWLEPISLAGLTVREAQEKVQRAYLENDMLRAPKVTIIVETYTRSTVSIPANVQNTGLVNLDPTTTNNLVDVILRAGGFGELANGNKVSVIRIQPDGSQIKLGPFKVDDMIKGSEPIEKAPLMQPDDIVDIPTRIF